MIMNGNLDIYFVVGIHFFFAFNIYEVGLGEMESWLPCFSLIASTFLISLLQASLKDTF